MYLYPRSLAIYGHICTHSACGTRAGIFNGRRCCGCTLARAFVISCRQQNHTNNNTQHAPSSARMLRTLPTFANRGGRRARERDAAGMHTVYSIVFVRRHHSAFACVPDVDDVLVCICSSFLYVNYINVGQKDAFGSMQGNCVRCSGTCTYLFLLKLFKSMLHFL